MTTYLTAPPPVGTWLRPRLTLGSSFLLRRDPNARAPLRDIGDTAGGGSHPPPGRQPPPPGAGAPPAWRGPPGEPVCGNAAPAPGPGRPPQPPPRPLPPGGARPP